MREYPLILRNRVVAVLNESFVRNVESFQFEDRTLSLSEVRQIARDSAPGVSLVGGDGFDKLVGTDKNDIIRAGRGDDVIVDGGGNDVIYADAGDDRIILGAGNDMVSGGQGNDTVVLRNRFNSTFSILYGGRVGGLV